MGYHFHFHVWQLADCSFQHRHRKFVTPPILKATIQTSNWSSLLLNKMTDARSQLLDVLDNAASQQPEKVKLAQQQLKQWETSPDFYATLQVSTNCLLCLHRCLLELTINLFPLSSKRIYFMTPRCLSTFDSLLVYTSRMVLTSTGARQPRSK